MVNSEQTDPATDLASPPENIGDFQIISDLVNAREPVTPTA
jgi:hypothetical protein